MIYKQISKSRKTLEFLIMREFKAILFMKSYLGLIACNLLCAKVLRKVQNILAKL
jgi:hypothetical protein